MSIIHTLWPSVKAHSALAPLTGADSPVFRAIRNLRFSDPFFKFCPRDIFCLGARGDESQLSLAN